MDVYGHEKAKKVLRTIIKRSKERYYKKCVLKQEDYPRRLNCLLIGPSGTGKSFLVKSLAKELDFPLLCIDATQLTPSGNNDGINVKQLEKKIEQMITEYLNKIGYHSREGILNQLVIFVDEFDKLGNTFESSGQWNKHVQANFLTIIENYADYSGISWIFAGAFTGLYDSLGSREIGFFSSKEQSSAEISEKDIIKAGIIPEMLGRISLIVELDRFTLQDYKNMLKILLSQEYNTLKDVDEEQMAKKALGSDQGVRSLIRQLELLLIDQEENQLEERNSHDKF